MENLRFENQLDEKTKLLILEMEKNLESKNSEIQAKNAEINKLKNELEFLKSQILNKNKKMLGKSSEQVDSNQMSLFDEAEKNSDNKIAEPTVLEVTYTRKKDKESKGKKDNLAYLEKVVIEHKLADGETHIHQP